MRKWIKGSIANTILLNAATIFVAGMMAWITSPWFWSAGIVVTAALWLYRWWVVRTDKAADEETADVAESAKLTRYHKAVHELRAALSEEIASMERNAVFFKGEMRPEVALPCMDRYKDLAGVLEPLEIHLPTIKETFGSNRSLYSPHQMRDILQALAKYTATGDVTGARKRFHRSYDQ